MCLMICLKPGVVAGPELAQAIRTGRLMNDDGAGFCVMEQAADGRWIAHGQVFLDDTDFVIEQFLACRARCPDGPALLHLRYGTCGHRNLANVQPWQLSPGVVLAMTGHYFDTGSHGLSDSRIIAERMKNADLRDPRLRDGLDALLPEHCTMALIVDGELHIYGEKEGHWHHGAWFSNSEFIHPGASDGDHTWTGSIEDDIALKRLYRKLGNALVRPDLCPDTAAEINSLRGDVIASRPLSRGLFCEPS